MVTMIPDVEAGQIEEDGVDDADGHGRHAIAVVVLRAPVMASWVQIQHRGGSHSAATTPFSWTSLLRNCIAHTLTSPLA